MGVAEARSERSKGSDEGIKEGQGVEHGCIRGGRRGCRGGLCQQAVNARMSQQHESRERSQGRCKRQEVG